VARAVALLVLAAACGGGSSAPESDAAVPVWPPPPGTDPAVEQVFPAGTRSLRLTKTVAVRLEPSDASKQIGTIAQDTRVGWTATDRGAGCTKPWVSIVPRGWVCSAYLEPLPRAPSGVELPRLERGELVPGTYGKVFAQNVMTYVIEDDKTAPGRKRPAPPPAPPAAKPDAAGPVTSPDELDGDGPIADAGGETADGRRVVPGKPLVGSVNVRKFGELVAGGRIYWKITKSPAEYIPASYVTVHEPSAFAGVRLGDETGLALPIGFVFPRGGGKKVWTYGTQKKQFPHRQVEHRTALPILDTVLDPRTGKPQVYRVGDDEWIDARELRVVSPAAPPAQMDPRERWIDVDGDQQVLVAYEGTLPVYATLVSNGLKDTPTDPGIYRVWKKVMETDMRDLQSEDPYSVATVPWTQFFYPDDGLALHTAYWHDKFGTARSHGCVNLAPADARWLYFWSDPWVPPGWTMAAGVVEAPGSIVRIRTAAVPDPPLRGYAKRVWEEAQIDRGAEE
jgi:hypothetical protein